MSDTQLSLWVVAIAVGLFSAWRNPTALALLLAFAASERGLPTEFYIYPDVITIAVIFCKPDYRPCPDYSTVWHQLLCILTERSPSDRIVLLTMPAAWYLYVTAIDPYYQWWGLYWLAMAQFAAAGTAPLTDTFIRRRNADAVNSPPPWGSLLVAYPAGGNFG